MYAWDTYTLAGCTLLFLLYLLFMVSVEACHRLQQQHFSLHLKTPPNLLRYKKTSNYQTNIQYCSDTFMIYIQFQELRLLMMLLSSSKDKLTRLWSFSQLFINLWTAARCQKSVQLHINVIWKSHEQWQMQAVKLHLGKTAQRWRISVERRWRHFHWK